MVLMHVATAVTILDPRRTNSLVASYQCLHTKTAFWRIRSTVGLRLLDAKVSRQRTVLGTTGWLWRPWRFDRMQAPQTCSHGLSVNQHAGTRLFTPPYSLSEPRMTGEVCRQTKKERVSGCSSSVPTRPSLKPIQLDEKQAGVRSCLLWCWEEKDSTRDKRDKTHQRDHVPDQAKLPTQADRGRRDKRWKERETRIMRCKTRSQKM
jgi:hypothetical protein